MVSGSAVLAPGRAGAQSARRCATPLERCREWKLDAKVKDGDRVEIYRHITADPETVPRRDQGPDDDD
jgi:hypothetical protein